MRPDDNASAPDLDELDGDESTPVVALDADPTPRAEDVEAEPVAFLDEDLLEAELGELDAPLPHDELDDIDEQLLDSNDDDDDDDDDFEMALLHELGIDLDAPDAEEADLDLGVSLDDDSNDEEVAA